jgi:AcrR family transcriptional regulator
MVRISYWNGEPAYDEVVASPPELPNAPDGRSEPPRTAAVSAELPQAADARSELPQAPGRPERADAARNRASIIAAAERMLRNGGVDCITMDRLACEAGVGKGTLFRRFGDRASLFHALLDETEKRLQEGFIRGPPPLGPGAPAAERLVAFGEALIEVTAERGDLLLAAQPPGPARRYGHPVHAAYRAHVTYLLRELGTSDPDYLTDVLLGALGPELVLYQFDRGMTVDDCKLAWEALVRRLVT